LARPPPSDLATLYSFPPWLITLFERELGAEAAPLARSLNLKGPVTIRVNTARLGREELQAKLFSEGVRSSLTAHSPIGLHLEGRPNILGLPSHRAGLFEVQDEGSQLVGLLVGACTGATVLDLCAGAGGKTLLLANEVGPNGLVYAYDIDHDRLARLRRRAERAGLTNVRVLQEIPSELQAHRVLVDAPCSSLGTLRRGPDMRFRIDPLSLEQWQSTQRRLLDIAAGHLVPGGRLVYATCTLRREENEAVAREFERTHPSLRRVPPAAPWLTPSFEHDGFFRSLPHRHGTDAFFGAVFE
jgi:16S rRNA (cytosine967-C5)-methyltransferase